MKNDEEKNIIKKSDRILKKIVLWVLVAIVVFNIGKIFLQPYVMSMNMENFLKKRYNKEFTVAKSNSLGNEGFGFFRAYHAIATEKKTGVKFGVLWNKTDGFDDNYLAMLWKEQGKKLILPELEKIYGKDILLKDYTCSYKARKKYKDIELIKNLNHDEVLEKYGKNMIRNIFFAVFVDKPVDKEKEAERAYELYNSKIKKDGIKSYIITIFYIFTNRKQEYIEAYKKMAEKKESDIGFDKSMYNEVLQIDWTSKFNTPADIIKYYDKEYENQGGN